MKRTFPLLILLLPFLAHSQPRIKNKKYPSLLWEISGNGLQKKSYLFGTMHVSSKLAFNLADSFYIGIRKADVVALETNPESWQEDMSKYDLGTGNGNGRAGFVNIPSDYLRQSTLKYYKYEKRLERALYSSPSVINNLLYRTYGDESSDFEEDTYLDMYIYQCGKKWGKKVAGVEQYGESMRLMAEAYKDAAKDKSKKERSYDNDNSLSSARLQEAYRTGNLDWLDSINRYNSFSAAFDEKFLYKRNDIQAASIDSILRTGQSLFVGVGAAHLPGERGVIEILRNAGYKLRPVRMGDRDSQHKSQVEKLRVPVKFATQMTDDSLFKVDIPGKFYQFAEDNGFDQRQYADMANGSYYMVSRIMTNAWMWGHNTERVYRIVDSLLYENIPGKIISKTKITRNGYAGIDLTNKTRRGDIQRYHIFITPFEIIVFKMSGTGEYVQQGEEAKKFFGSISFREYGADSLSNWSAYTPEHGGFSVLMPHRPYTGNDGSWIFDAGDKATSTYYRVVRSDIHNYNFVGEDTFDLTLLDESFAASEFINSQTGRRFISWKGYPALDASYTDKNGNIYLNRFIIRGPHYYTLTASGPAETPAMKKFLDSFTFQPYRYRKATEQTDTSLYYSVKTPFYPAEEKEKLDMLYNRYSASDEEDDPLVTGMFRSKIVGNDTTGEKIFVVFFKTQRYYQVTDSAMLEKEDFTSIAGDSSWIVRSRKRYDLPDSTKVWEQVLSDTASSRTLATKVYYRNGIGHILAVQGDTLTAPSDFVRQFFETFRPADTLQGSDPLAKKSLLFFEDFMSADSVARKRALKGIYQVKMDETDLPQLRRAIDFLKWDEKNYLTAKKTLIDKLAGIRTKEATNLLKDMYYAAGDTLELQYAALGTMLAQKTPYAFTTFRDMVMADPPVLGGVENTMRYNNNFTFNLSAPAYSVTGDFMEGLSDSLRLSRSILPSLLPLIELEDYKESLLDLLKNMADSGLVTTKDYAQYYNKLLLEAKQELKKQLIGEKQRAIQQAEQQKDETSYNPYSRKEGDAGNERLDRYAALLIPFWNKEKTIQPWFLQMLTTSDKELKLNTVLLLLRHNKQVPDTMLAYFAGLDDYRYRLYAGLRQLQKLSLFPAKHNNHIDLAKSRLLLSASYEKPDSVYYIDRLPAQIKDRKGYAYFFRYKQKKDDITWRIGVVGLLPENPAEFEWPDQKSKVYQPRRYSYSYFGYDDNSGDYNITGMGYAKLKDYEPVDKQLEKQLKKILYGLKKSGREFYSEYEDEEAEDNAITVVDEEEY